MTSDGSGGAAAAALRLGVVVGAVLLLFLPPWFVAMRGCAPVRRRAQGEGLMSGRVVPAGMFSLEIRAYFTVCGVNLLL